MRDLLDREINIGDSVILLVAYNNAIHPRKDGFTVEGFSPLKVRLRYRDDNNTDYTYVILKKPEYLIVKHTELEL